MKKNYTFNESCVIKRNTPYIKQQLREIGYDVSGIENQNCIVTTKNAKATSVDTDFVERYFIGENKSSIDCDENINLFLALAALRDDTDIHQWFFNQKDQFWIYCSFDKFPDTVRVNNSIIPEKFHKASTKELIKHFSVVQKYHISDILKDYEKGTELYSPICGTCFLRSVEEDFDGNSKTEIIIITSKEGSLLKFSKDGHFINEKGYSFVEGECMLFPDKDKKLAWESLKKVCISKLLKYEQVKPGYELQFINFDGERIDCSFDYIDENDNIVVNVALYNNKYLSLKFTKYGRNIETPNGKCMLYRKGKDRWENEKDSKTY